MMNWFDQTDLIIYYYRYANLKFANVADIY